ncbi:MAG: hypothetical protein ACE5KE_00285 [Methanosarcinales archaeon]
MKRCDCGKKATYKSKITNRFYCSECVDEMISKGIIIKKEYFEKIGFLKAG